MEIIVLCTLVSFDSSSLASAAFDTACHCWDGKKVTVIYTLLKTADESSEGSRVNYIVKEA